jgi:uncharacterized membrane protein YdbT with pleckstrin-like domain
MNDQRSSLDGFDPGSITRPDPALMTYYTLVCALTLLGFPFLILPAYFKFHTLQYRFDDKGIAMSWGVLFKREIYLTYRRIQDIQVTRNLFHRWLGLAAVAIQTAAGSASAEMTIEGIREPEKLRDFLYLRMRGSRDATPPAPDGQPLQPRSDDDEALGLLREIRDEVRALRGPGSGRP